MSLPMTGVDRIQPVSQVALDCASWSVAGPRSASSLRIVGFETAVMRAVARMLLPSTRATTTRQRRSVLNLFMQEV